MHKLLVVERVFSTHALLNIRYCAMSIVMESSEVVITTFAA